MPEQKTYCNAVYAKQVKFNNGNSIMKLSISVKKMIEFLNAHANEKGYVNLGVSERREVNEHGDTHCVWLDTWKPTPRGDGAPAKTTPANKPPTDEDFPPF